MVHVLVWQDDNRDATWNPVNLDMNFIRRWPDGIKRTTMGGQHLARNRRSSLLRSGHSLIEVWRINVGNIADGPHHRNVDRLRAYLATIRKRPRSIVTRQATIREIARRLEGATQLVGRVNGSQLRFIGPPVIRSASFNAGPKSTGNNRYGSFDWARYWYAFIRLLSEWTQPIQGRVVDVRLRNPRGTSGNNQESRLLVWVKPVI